MIKKCPYCGKKVSIEHQILYNSQKEVYYITCKGLNLYRTSPFCKKIVTGYSKKEVIKKWNDYVKNEHSTYMENKKRGN